MNWFSLIVIGLVFETNQSFSLKPRVETSEDAFDVFLRNALNNYTSWIRDNNLDPSPPSILEDDLSIAMDNFHLTCKITSEQVVGYSNPSNQFEVYRINTAAALRWVTIELNNVGIVSFQGAYTANGTVAADVPLDGNGSWIYTSNRGLRENLNLVFNVTEDGYIDISDETRYMYWVNPFNDLYDEIYFEGLWDDVASGYAEVVRENLLSTYANRLRSIETRQPTRQLLRQYLEQVFQETSFEDIIGTGKTTA